MAGERSYYINQEDINDLIREMALTKSNAELLISRLKQWDLLDDSVRITRENSIAAFPCYSLPVMDCATAMTSEDSTTLWVFLATPLTGGSSSTVLIA